MPQQISKENSRVFSFTESGWISRVIASDVCLAVLAALLIWFKLVYSVLPSKAWINFPLTIVGVMILYVLFELILRTVVSGPICGWMERYDERVSPNSSAREQKQANDPRPGSSDVETAFKQKGI